MIASWGDMAIAPTATSQNPHRDVLSAHWSANNLKTPPDDPAPPHFADTKLPNDHKKLDRPRSSAGELLPHLPTSGVESSTNYLAFLIVNPVLRYHLSPLMAQNN